jgi:YYY domain-containing protein
MFFLSKVREKKILKEDFFVLFLIFVSFTLILIPELVYVKDIYPAHYRANTMFKLVYQAFIMLAFVSSFAIVRIVGVTKNYLFYLISIILLAPVFSYPYLAVKSYYGDLKIYSGLDGTSYLKNRHPEDYQAIKWIEKNIKGRPVIVEAQGDSYTDYARISANTGLPTILGWTVHEWLWRGTYDIPAPRIDEVKAIYENADRERTIQILKKYNVALIYVGNLEREKYPNLIESKFNTLGEVIFEIGKTKIYKIEI